MEHGRFSEQAYKTIQAVCLALALVSVFVFDSVGQLNWIFGLTAVLAALVASGVHLYQVL